MLTCVLIFLVNYSSLIQMLWNARFGKTIQIMTKLERDASLTATGVLMGHAPCSFSTIARGMTQE